MYKLTRIGLRPERKNRASIDESAGFTDQKTGGADKIRTCDPHNAIVVLYQLSYDPSQKFKTRI